MEKKGREIEQFLIKHLAEFPRAPFLFVGAGVSRRYLNSEGWEGLLRKFAETCGSKYEFLRASANGDFPRIATLLANDFHKYWWENSKYDENRELYKEDTKNEESALKIEVSDYLAHKATVITSLAIKKELELLSQIVIDGIITTNYDVFLEDIFSEFTVYIGQDKLIFSSSHGIGEIYKIHGCCTEPNSLVLTQGDYATYNQRNPYLIAKLLTVFTEHPIIFIGYTITDENVRSIIKSIASCLTNDNIDRLRDRLIFVEYVHDKDFEGTVSNSSLVLGDFVVPVVNIKVFHYEQIFSALGALKRKFPARLLRQLKEHVYELVVNSDSHERLYVQNIEDAEADLSEIDVVFGVGAISKINQKGYTGLTWQEIYEDVLDGGSYDSIKIVDEVLPKLLKASKYVPVFKYLRESGKLDNDGNLIDPKVDTRVFSASKVSILHFYPSEFYSKQASKLPKAAKEINDYFASCSNLDVLKFIALFPEGTINPDWIFDFLKENRHYMHSQNSFEVTQYKKMLCLYDFLKFRKAPIVVKASSTTS
jgi:hypothetical protein